MQFEKSARELADQIQAQEKDIPRINEFLEWFCEHIVKQTIPVAGSTIREFIGLEWTEIAARIKDYDPIRRR